MDHTKIGDSVFSVPSDNSYTESIKPIPCPVGFRQVGATVSTSTKQKKRKDFLVVLMLGFHKQSFPMTFGFMLN